MASQTTVFTNFTTRAFKLVQMAGFEPATPCFQNKQATPAPHLDYFIINMCFKIYLLKFLCVGFHINNIFITVTSISYFGSIGEHRTHKLFLVTDFESVAFTYFATMPLLNYFYFIWQRVTESNCQPYYVQAWYSKPLRNLCATLYKL